MHLTKKHSVLFKVLDLPNPKNTPSNLGSLTTSIYQLLEPVMFEALIAASVFVEQIFEKKMSHPGSFFGGGICLLMELVSLSWSKTPKSKKHVKIWKFCWRSPKSWSTSSWYPHIAPPNESPWMKVKALVGGHGQQPARECLKDLGFIWHLFISIQSPLQFQTEVSVPRFHCSTWWSRLKDISLHIM